MHELLPLLPFLLFLHLIGVMVGLGPTFVFARITGAAAREPAHMRFASTVVRSIASEWSHPLAGLVFLSGLAMILVIGLDVFARGWLALSIVLFVPSYLYASLVQNRDIGRVLELTADGPPEPASAEATEMARRRVRIRRGGLYMRATALVILFLMVVKPF